MSSHEPQPKPQEQSHEADQGRPDLSTIKPLRTVEEVEQAARPGFSAREREAEDRDAERGTDERGTDVELPIPAPGGSEMSGGPSLGGPEEAFGGFSVAAGPLQMNKGDEDDEEDEDHARR